jgi:osmotically-inducible protein OsmY
MKKLSLVAVSVSALALASACTPLGLATGAAATAGVASAQEGGITGAVTDASIKGAINEAWFRKDLDMFSKLSTRVDQGRVLLTGVVQNPEHRVEAVRLVWQVKGVKQVINEIQVADSEGLPGWGRDTWISTRLRTEMTFAKEISSLNYTIDTVQGVVYLMGVARSQDELNRVMELARTIPNVKKVVSYVKMIGEPVQGSPVTQ